MKRNVVAVCCVLSMKCLGGNVDSTQVVNAGLPVLYIETIDSARPTFKVARKDNPDYLGETITDETKVPGRVFICEKESIVYDSKDYEKGISGMTIKVRGNTSAAGNKKLPYKIKLEKKADMLNRGNDSIYRDKNWLLIKDGAFKNTIGYKLNELIGMQWTPASRYVNVFFNGSYEGLYLLIESVRRNTRCRLNVSDTGFIAEFDPYWWNEDVYVRSTLPWHPWLMMHYTFKYPDSEDITDEQLRYFKRTVRKAEESLIEGNYSQYIDVESFARWILAHDILGIGDGAGSNYYFTKYDNTDNSKLMMANLWDLESAMTQSGNWSTVHRIGIFYYYSLFEGSNETFKKRYKDIWRIESADIINNMYAFLDNYKQSDEAVAMDKSIALDNLRWDDDNDNIWECIDDAEKWFRERKDWLDEAINDIYTGIETIREKKEKDNAVYYNLKGQKILKPSKGLFIKKTNGQRNIVIIR